MQPLSPELCDLESEAIEILRESYASGARTVLLYSIGKDSSVLLHLARKAFYPSPIPFPLLHIDTGWKFREMIGFRDRIAANAGLTLDVYKCTAGEREGISPLTHDPAYYTSVMKTQALRDALDAGAYDIVIGGARRDEEKSRAKERVFSHRGIGHTWNPRAQRAELWNLYNPRVRKGESIRVFPLSNWTEIDVWRYISHEQIEVVPLYFAARRPVICRGGQLIVQDDERLQPSVGETVEYRQVRFRTLGCYPLTAAMDSDAVTVDDIIDELLRTGFSERQGRLIDHDDVSSMERKKMEGYF